MLVLRTIACYIPLLYTHRDRFHAGGIGLYLNPKAFQTFFFAAFGNGGKKKLWLL